MTTASLPLPARGRTLVASVALAALAVWVLDGLFATSFCLTVSPTCTVVRTWQGVAGALVGRPATFDGGAATFALGLAMHLAVASTWAALYGLAYARSETLARRTSTPAGATLVGAALGCLVWIVMSLIVVPLTRNPPTPVTSPYWWAMLVGHAVVVGQPIAWLVRRRTASA